MEAAELQQLIEELETRVERLRAVYEQYFMGIERLEPLIQRKDVDRRLWRLRREQIRNTGMRFKLETTIQRYNTYQQYWARIVREIESGTYHRDLTRAAARFGETAVTAFGKRRQRMFERGLAKKAEREAARKGRTALSAGADDQVSGRLASGGSADGDERAPASGESFDVAFEDSEIFAEPVESVAEPAQPLELDMQFGPPPEAPPAPRFAPMQALPRASAQLEPPRNAPTPRHGSFPPPPPPKPPSPQAAPAVARHVGPFPPVPPRAPVRTPAAGTTAVPDSQVSGRLASGGSAEELSPVRLREIYGQYVEAKRKANESTAQITYDKIATNLRETARQLQSQHQGRKVDFEVVMKNGKPVLKPVVKG